MATVADDLNLIQERLHDGGAIWPRAELLRWYRDGYRDLIARSQCVGRLTCLGVPGQVTAAHTFPWEARYVSGGTHWQWTMSTYDEQAQVSFTWEAQMLAGAPVTEGAAEAVYTQPWERAFVGDSSQEFIFALPRNHERIRAVWWDHQRLYPITTRELDASEMRWMRLAGEPTHWTEGFGRNRMFDIFAVRTDYQQGYHHSSLYGIPRHFSGERTYGLDQSGLGLVRWVSSPERQYWPHQQSQQREALGIARTWGSSEHTLLVWESIIPDVPDLGETESPALIPAASRRYLRDYVLWQARGRTGEGQDHRMAKHYQARYTRGIALLRKLADVAFADRHWLREPVTPGSKRPPRVTLPPQFPRVNL